MEQILKINFLKIKLHWYFLSERRLPYLNKNEDSFLSIFGKPYFVKYVKNGVNNSFI